MKLILEVRNHEDDTRHYSFSDFPVRIGRAFNNDVIVSDPFVSPHHLCIDREGDAYTVVDTGSENGFSINGEPKSSAKTELRSGDKLLLGETGIFVYTPDHPVADTLPLRREHQLFGWIAVTRNVWTSFLVALILTFEWAWLTIFTPDGEGLALTSTTATAAGIIIFWATVWSVAGRLTRRHKANFQSHVALASLCMIVSRVAWYVGSYINFLTSDNWLSQAVTYGFNSVLLGFLLYGSLTLASKMPHKRKVAVAALLSLGLTASAFLFNTLSTHKFNQQPVYSASLEPYLDKLAPTQTVGAFMKDNNSLFAADTFVQVAKSHKAAQSKAPVIPFQRSKHK